MRRKDFYTPGVLVLLAAMTSLLVMSCGDSSTTNDPPATYTIGGTVSGLDGTVVLQNNGGTGLTRTANGTFTFSSSLNEGASYSVTVSGQPSGQTCSVTSGSGTANANVTNVQVSCTNNPYTVGGSVSGLNGTLILQNSGGDDETVTADGSFTFSTEADHGETYSVAVSSQPTGQTCSVTNGSGTIGAADVTSVQVICGDNTYAVGGSVGGLTGTLVLQNNGGDDETIDAIGPFNFTTELTNGDTYNVTVLTQPTDQNCSITNGSGTISAGDVTNIQVTCADVYVSTGWTPNPTKFEDGFNSPGVSPERFHVAIANNGDAVVAYYDYLNSTDFFWDVFKIERRDGTWSFPDSFDDSISKFTNPDNHRLNDQNADTRVAMSDNGETVITYSQDDTFGDCQSENSIYRVEYREISTGVFEWSLPSSEDDHIDWSCIGPVYQTADVAMNGSGETVIAWAQKDHPNPSAVYKSEFRDGSWSDPQSTDDRLSSPLDNYYLTMQMPSVAMNDGGDAIIEWKQIHATTPYDYGVIKTEYDSGTGTWEPLPAGFSSRINEPANYLYGDIYTDVALSNNGDAVIVWQQSTADNTNYQIFLSEKIGGNWATSPVAISDPNNHALKPKVAMDNTDNAVIVWQQSDGTNDRIYMYENRGSGWDGPIAISPAGTDAEAPQVVMAGDSGDTVIIWRQNDSQDFNMLYMYDYRNGSWSPSLTLDNYISLPGSIGSEVGGYNYSTDEPHLAIDDLGNTIILWEQYDPVDREERLFISEYTSVPQAVGQLDTTFNGNGIVVDASAAGGTGDDSGEAIMTDGSGNVFVAGYSHNSAGNDDMVIWKYLSNGELDTAFSTNGIVVYDGGASDRGSDIASDSQGNIIVAGYSVDAGNYNMAIWKYQSDGTPDATFGTNGMVVYDDESASADFAYTLAVDNSDNIFVAGYSSVGGVATMTILKYDSSGILDASFGGGDGIAYGDIAGANTAGYDLCLDNAGNIFVAGYSSMAAGQSDMPVWKFLSDGTPDPTFGTDGVVLDGDAYLRDTGYGIALDQEGNVYVVGHGQPSGSVTLNMVGWKYTNEGVLDGTIVYDSAQGSGRGIVLDALGNIFIGGYSHNADVDFDMTVWKYTREGVLDDTFGTGGIVMQDSMAGGGGLYPHDYGYDLDLDDSGNIFITGKSMDIGGYYYDMAIVKYK